MIKYSIVSSNRKYHVKENPTNQKIAKFDSWSLAKKYRDFLNNGGGFDGFTPEFILKPVKTKSL